MNSKKHENRKQSKRIFRTPTYQALRVRTAEIQTKLNTAKGQIAHLTTELEATKKSLEAAQAKIKELSATKAA